MRAKEKAIAWNVPYKRLSQRLKEIRLLAGFSQAHLAKLLNLANSTVAQYETLSRKPDLEVAERWAEKCGHSLVVDVVPNDQDWRLHRAIDAMSPAQRQLLEEFLSAMPQIDEDRTNTLRVLFGSWRPSASSPATEENVSKDTKMRALKA